MAGPEVYRPYWSLDIQEFFLFFLHSLTKKNQQQQKNPSPQNETNKQIKISPWPKSHKPHILWRGLAKCSLLDKIKTLNKVFGKGFTRFVPHSRF